MKKKIVSVMVLAFSFCLSVVAKADSAAMSLAAKAPADSVFLVSSSGYTNLKDEVNATLMAEIVKDPQVKSFYESIKNLVVSQVGEVPAEFKEKFAGLRQAVMDAGLHLDPKVCGVLVNSIDTENEKVDGCIYMISEGGAARATAIKSFINTVITTLDGSDKIKVSEFTSTTLGPVVKYEVAEETPFSLNIAVKGKYVVAVLVPNDFSQKYLDTIAACCDSKATKFGDFDNLTSKGDDIVAMFNMPAYIKIFTSIMDSVEKDDQKLQEAKRVKELFDSIQVDSFGKMYYRLGFQGKQVVVDTVFTQPKKYNDMAKPINTELLRTVAADATYVCTVNYDLAKIIAMYEDMLSKAMPQSEFNQISAGISEFETENAIALREGIFNNLTGEVVASFTVNPTTGMLNSTGFTVLTVKNSDLFISEFNKLVNLFVSELGQQVTVTYDQTEVDGIKVNTLSIPQAVPFGVQPCLAALDGNHVVFGLTQATALNAVTLYASGQRQGTILSNAKFKTAFEGTPKEKITLQYTDSESLLKAFCATGNTYYPLLSMMASGQGINLPPTLPQLSSKFDDLPPSVSWSAITADGVARTHAVTDGTGYVAVAGAYTGVMASVLMPALSRAKELAKRTEAVAEMKQIAIGLVMYCSDNNSAMPEKLEDISKYLANETVVTPAGCSPITYRGMGLKTSSNPNIITAYTNDNEKYIVAFVDGHVEQINFDEFADRIEADNQLRNEAELASIDLPEADAQIIEDNSDDWELDDDGQYEEDESEEDEPVNEL